MYLVIQTSRCKVNRVDLGLEITESCILVPEELGIVLTAVGAWTCDSLAKALLEYPIAFMQGLQLSAADFANARDGALGKLATVAGAAELSKTPIPGA